MFFVCEKCGAGVPTSEQGYCCICGRVTMRAEAREKAPAPIPGATREGDAFTPAVSARQLQMMRHAVGAKFHRNHYVTTKGTEDDSLWSLLVLAGHAEQFDESVTSRTFHLKLAAVEVLKRSARQDVPRLFVAWCSDGCGKTFATHGDIPPEWQCECGGLIKEVAALETREDEPKQPATGFQRARLPGWTHDDEAPEVNQYLDWTMGAAINGDAATAAEETEAWLRGVDAALARLSSRNAALEQAAMGDTRRLLEEWQASAIEVIALKAELRENLDRARAIRTEEPGQTDAEIGAMVRAAYAAHNSQSGSLVELDRIESVVVSGVFGPGKLELTVRHSSRLKPGVPR
jgi:hypothetical protein